MRTMKRGMAAIRQRVAERQAAGLLRYSYDCKGRILRIPNGIVVVPYEQVSSGWYAVVVDPGPEPRCQTSYPRGGYNIVVSDHDVETATEMIPTEVQS